ncbi:hypothetical protein [Hymenobacter volaticus]|uniref:Alpha/beta hydrolase n=1 Tax=Hymenobacter volaticus TaxID=2932254 RepID=A0ABY4G899_9BACT|nr:hypothetical protein [Hymenobacter volaticus]UOQ67067.1 hypothetical protein MUN86_03930 [Hymenobacter volaticus]
MKKLLLTLAFGACSHLLLAQQVMSVYSVTIPNSKPSDVKETTVTEANGGIRVSNVIQPTLTVYKPAKDKANGTAVIICPGVATPD